jgi:hypothetical protein
MILSRFRNSVISFRRAYLASRYIAAAVLAATVAAVTIHDWNISH